MTEYRQNRVGRPARGAPARIEHILAVAAQMFLREGYGTVSIEAIAAKGGLSKATIYRHFSGKPALFAAVLSDLLARHADDAGLAVALSHPPEKGLTGFANISLDLMSSGDGLALFRLVVGASRRFPEVGAIFYERAMGVMIARLEDYLARQHAEGRLHVPEPDLSAFQFLGLYKEALFWPKLVLGARSPVALNRDRVIARAVEIFLGAHTP